MAWFDDNSVFSFGKYKGKKVSDVNDARYISWLHHSNYNVYFVQTVLDKHNIKNTGLMKPDKNSPRTI